MHAKFSLSYAIYNVKFLSTELIDSSIKFCAQSSASAAHKVKFGCKTPIVLVSQCIGRWLCYKCKIINYWLLCFYSFIVLQIVSAFHIRSGASNFSYMGKGVSRCATQCILHLAREISTLDYSVSSELLETN